MNILTPPGLPGITNILGSTPTPTTMDEMARVAYERRRREAEMATYMRQQQQQQQAQNVLAQRLGMPDYGTALGALQAEEIEQSREAAIRAKETAEFNNLNTAYDFPAKKAMDQGNKKLLDSIADRYIKSASPQARQYGEFLKGVDMKEAGETDFRFDFSRPASTELFMKMVGPQGAAALGVANPAELKGVFGDDTVTVKKITTPFGGVSYKIADRTPPVKTAKTETFPNSLTGQTGASLRAWAEENKSNFANPSVYKNVLQQALLLEAQGEKNKTIYRESFNYKTDEAGKIFNFEAKEKAAPAQVIKMVIPGAPKPKAVYQQVTGVPGMTFNKETGEYAIKVKGKSIPIGDSERVAQERENFRQRMTEASVRGGVQTAKYVAAADVYDKEITEIIDLRNKVAAKLPDMKFTSLNAAQQWWGTKTSDREVNELKRRTKLLADTLSRTMGGTGGQWAFQLANELLDTSLDAGTFAAVARDHGKTLRNMATAYQNIGKPSTNDPLGIR